jgi:hypothetical protein
VQIKKDDDASSPTNPSTTFTRKLFILPQVSDREASLLGSSAVKVLSYPTSSSAYVVRLVTHSDLSDDDVEAAKAKIIYVAENILERDN